MSLSRKKVDALFWALRTRYPSWHTYIDLPAEKIEWTEKLPFDDVSWHKIEWALQNLPDEPPTVSQLIALAKRAPVPSPWDAIKNGATA
jgi:hypothetical protein